MDFCHPRSIQWATWAFMGLKQRKTWTSSIFATQTYLDYTLPVCTVRIRCSSRICFATMYWQLIGRQKQEHDEHIALAIRQFVSQSHPSQRRGKGGREGGSSQLPALSSQPSALSSQLSSQLWAPSSQLRVWVAWPHLTGQIHDNYLTMYTTTTWQLYTTIDFLYKLFWVRHVIKRNMNIFLSLHKMRRVRNNL